MLEAILWFKTPCFCNIEDALIPILNERKEKYHQLEIGRIIVLVSNSDDSMGDIVKLPHRATGNHKAT